MRQLLLKKLRERLTKLDELFHKYVKALSNLYPYSTIILFGSRARGECLPYSDYDIMIIIKDINDKIERVVNAYKIKPPELAVDLVLISEKELEDPIIEKMLREGCKIIYDGLGIIHRLLRICNKNEHVNNQQLE